MKTSTLFQAYVDTRDFREIAMHNAGEPTVEGDMFWRERYRRYDRLTSKLYRRLMKALSGGEQCSNKPA